MKKKIDISILIPFFNESDNIIQLVDNLNNFISTLKNILIEIIFIDDGSSDDSVNLLLKTSHISYYAKIIKLSKNFGSHAALRAGILNSSGRYVMFMYADLQDPLELIIHLYNKCKEGLDIVWATRKSINTNAIEKIFSHLYAKLMQKYVNENFPEKGFDIVMFNSLVRAELNENIESNSSIFLHILTLGFNQDSIEYQRRERKAGKSKWTFSKKFKLVVDSFVAYSYFPIRLVSIIGFTLSIIGFIWVVYIGLRAIILKDLSQGWPTLVSVLLIGFGITNISLGIIAEYLWRTLDVSRKRKVFIIDKIIDLK